MGGKREEEGRKEGKKEGEGGERESHYCVKQRPTHDGIPPPGSGLAGVVSGLSVSPVPLPSVLSPPVQLGSPHHVVPPIMMGTPL